MAQKNAKLRRGSAAAEFPCNHGKMELGIMLAVEALEMSMGIISIDKSLLETGFDGGNAGRIPADRRLGNTIRFLGTHRSQLVLDTQQGEDQGHTHIHAELYLLEVAGPGTLVHFGSGVIDTGQRDAARSYPALQEPSWRGRGHRHPSDSLIFRHIQEPAPAGGGSCISTSSSGQMTSSRLRTSR